MMGVVTALLLAACGSSDSSTSTSSAGGSGTTSSGSKEVVINSSGGVIDEAYKACFWDAFEKKTGITVKATGEAASALVGLKQQVPTNTVQWDLTEIYDTDYGAIKKNNLLMKLPLDKLPISSLKKEWYDDYGIWELPYATVLVYSTKKWPDGGPQPQKVTDLWNTKDFPGARGIQNNPYDNIEYGMEMAGKTNPYPVDFDTAFSQLDKLQPSVKATWTSGAQSMQLLQSGQVDMATMWNGRAYSLIQQGFPGKMVWDGAVLHVSYWSIPKGAPHADAAVKLLAYMYDPAQTKADACFAKRMGYAIPNQGLDKILDAKTLSALATSEENLKLVIPVDAQWWTDNQAEAQQRWQKWSSK
jgi:putative spermidine/putrescine transport system substrate-binding protein